MYSSSVYILPVFLLQNFLKKQPNLLDYIDEKVNEGDIIAFFITLETFTLLKGVYKRSNV